MQSKDADAMTISQVGQLPADASELKSKLQAPLPPSLESSRTSDVGCERHMDRPLPPVRRVEALFADAVGHDARLGRDCWIRILEAVGCTSEEAAAVFELVQRSVEQPHLCGRDIFRFLWGHEALGRAGSEAIDEEPAEAQEAAERNGQCQADAEVLSRNGWSELAEGRHEDALADFSRAIELDPTLAAAYNNRGITLQILGRDAEEDFDMADGLTMHDIAAYEALQLIRKWKPIGDKARGEAAMQGAFVEDDIYRRAQSWLPQSWELFCKLLRNVVAHPGESKYRRVKTSDKRVDALLKELGARDALASLGWALKDRGEFLQLSPEASIDAMAVVLQHMVGKVESLCTSGWKQLCEAKCEADTAEAAACFAKAIKMDPTCAAAYNNRGIAQEMLGMSDKAREDYSQADKLAKQPDEREKLKLTRKWKPIGFEARGEPKGKKAASEADFLISFASPDTYANNCILHHLQQGVHFRDAFRSISFCTDRTLGMGVHVEDGVSKGRADPQFNGDLDQARQTGEFPRWFVHYKKAAELTTFGILILQLTEDYFRSKACRWEFGYVRKPDLVHVFVHGVRGPQIVSWGDLMQNPGLCHLAFRQVPDRLGLERLANDMTTDKEVLAMQAFGKAAVAAELVEAQERQSWCALPLRQVAYALTRNLERSGPGIEAADALVLVCLKTGQAQRAKELSIRLVEILEDARGEHQESLAVALHNLGTAYQDLNDYVQMKEALARSLKITEQYFGARHPEVAKTLNNIGMAYFQSEDYHEAKKLYERSLEILEHHYGADCPDSADPLMNLGGVYNHLKEYSKAKQVLERSLKINEKQYGKESEHQRVALTQMNLGIVCRRLQDYPTSKEWLLRSLKTTELHYGAQHPQVAQVLLNLARTYFESMNDAEARPLFERSLGIFQIRAEHDPATQALHDLAETLHYLGLCHGNSNDFDKATELMERSLKIKLQIHGEFHPSVAETRRALFAARQMKDATYQLLASMSGGIPAIQEPEDEDLKEAIRLSMQVQEGVEAVPSRQLQDATDLDDDEDLKARLSLQDDQGKAGK